MSSMTREEEEAQSLSPNQWLIDVPCGWTRMAKLLEIEELPKQDEDFDTVGGLIFSRLNAVPTVGARVELPEYGLTFEVETVHERRAEKIKLTFHPPLPDEDYDE